MFNLFIILFPILIGLAVHLLKFDEHDSKKRNIFVLSGVILTSIFVVIFMINTKQEAFTLLQLTDSMSLTYRCDGLSYVFLSLIALLFYSEYPNSFLLFVLWLALVLFYLLQIILQLNLLNLHFPYLY